VVGDPVVVHRIAEERPLTPCTIDEGHGRSIHGGVVGVASGGRKDTLEGSRGAPEEHHDAITGHSNGSVGRSYGRGVPLKV
jgi:hypothetical protein